MHKNVRVVSLSDIEANDAELVGGKAANLSIMYPVFRVPPGFCITTDAFGSAFARLENDNVHRELIKHGNVNFNEHDFFWHKEILSESTLFAFRARLSQLNCPIIVRSSATLEDSVDYSFAGIFESIDSLCGEKEVLFAVKKCWLSLLNDKAQAYILHQGIDPQKVKMAVLIQEMITPEISGVAFSFMPSDVNKSHLLIESIIGKNRRLVDGEINPTSYIVDRKSISRSGCAYKVMGGKDRRTLNSHEIQSIAWIVLSLERMFDSPQDIEWGIINGGLFLFQARSLVIPK